MKQPIIKVSGLSHRYNVQWAIKDIDFEINKPGIYGLLGANGAGKSTTMNIICGALRQTHGEVLIKGVNLLKEPVKAKRHIGFLPQQPPLASELTVSEYLSYCANLRLMPASEIEQAVDNVMGKCQVSHFRHRVLGNLSGGYQQRVGIAQAIIHSPDFVVLDEPTNGLDPNQILEVRNLIREIAQEHTVVLSTHILQEVDALCEHIWMINEGMMVFSGPISDFNSQIQPDSLIVSFANSPGPESLKSLSGVRSVENLGINRYRLRYSNVQELSQQLVSGSYQHNWGLTELSPEKNSLENIFAELTYKKA